MEKKRKADEELEFVKQDMIRKEQSNEKKRLENERLEVIQRRRDAQLREVERNEKVKQRLE